MGAGRIGAIASLVAAIGAGAFYALRSPEPPPPEPQKAAEAPKPLQLYCQFYVFTEQRPRLGLMFDISSRDGAPVFAQAYIAEDNGARTDYDGKTEPRPEWRYDPATEPKTIGSIIKVPDTSQAGLHDEDIKIELYDYKPERDSKTFFEASLKNIHFQNLPGKCRQSRG